MFKKLLAFSLVSVLGVGVATASDVLPGDGGGGIPIEPEPDCEANCAAVVLLPGGTVCTLAGCVSDGSSFYCLYRCF